MHSSFGEGGICLDLYKIPGDSSPNWRFYKFIQYSSMEPDDTIGPMIHAMQELGYSPDKKCWAVFLYSTCYCLGTSLLCAELLDFKTISDASIEAFWKKNRSDLIFTSDRRYVKNMNWFPEIVKRFLLRTNRRPYDFFLTLLDKDPKMTYYNLYREISSWKYFGRFSAILLLRTLTRVMDWPMDFDLDYDWDSGATTTQGGLLLLHEDQISAQFDKSPRVLTGAYKDKLDALIRDIQLCLESNYPRKNSSMLYVTSDLCSYFKLYKATRYLGYYVDRGLSELRSLSVAYPKQDYIWKSIYNGRRSSIPKEYLGELNDWFGIRNERNTRFLRTGDF